jgi:hypothetical protein
VAGGNGTYASDGGCLYNASYTKLLVCPPAKSSIALNSALKIISSTAFNGCSRITSLTLPSSVTTIEGGAFSGSGIKNITIPKSVTSIGSQSWSPDIIYGYSGSQAETYAENGGYVFYALDGNSSGDSDDESTEVKTGNALYLDSDDDSDDITVGSESGSSGTTSKKSTSGSSKSSSSSSSSGSTASTVSTKKSSTTTSNSSGAYASTTSNVHTEDNTPQTGDGFDVRLLLCMALALAGAACFIVGKRKAA